MDQFAAADHLIGVAVDTSLVQGLALGCVVPNSLLVTMLDIVVAVSSSEASKSEDTEENTVEKTEETSYKAKQGSEGADAGDGK
jgi:hypothetical protein